jgi:diguanylate cyclase (GGDEF)-like protein/PAS domain S-box-containing protein
MLGSEDCEDMTTRSKSMTDVTASDDLATVVVIEDHPGDARLVREYLAETSESGIEWRHETTFEEGIEACRQLEPDAVLIDLSLPTQSPETTLERVGDIPGTAAIVVLTGADGRDTGQRALRHGADGYLNKEFLEPILLRTTVENAIERARLRRESRIAQRAIDAANDGIVIADARGDDFPIVSCNPAFEEITGYEESEIVGRNCRFLQCEDTARDAITLISRALEQGEAIDVELLNERRDGSRFWNQLSLSPVYDDSGELTHYIGIQKDVTHRVETERGLREQKRELEKYETIIENTTDAVTITDLEGRLQFLNETYAELIGAPHTSLVGRTERDLFEQHDIEHHVVSRRADDETNGVERLEEVLKSEGTRRVFLTMKLPFEEDGEAIGTIWIRRDITERKRAKKKLEHQATHDNLTGLPNRALFRKQLSEAVNAGRPFAIGFVDLDDFKAVNDSFGHTCGDSLLERVAERLTNVLRDDDMIARVGGDEFTCLLEDIEALEHLNTVAERICEVFEPPFDVEGAHLHLSASIGFARLKRKQLEDDAFVVHAESLRRAADRAMYRAKNQPGTSWETFDPSSRGERFEQIQRENRIRTGIRREEFVPYYQPMFHLDDGSPAALEVLARWQHPDRGMVSPGDFIPVAERSALIGDLCASLVEQTCRNAERWANVYEIDEDAPVFFNLSPVQISRESAVDTLLRGLETWNESDLPIGFEVTETNLLKYFEHIQKLRDAGHSIFVDDFGTGYSSFSRLRELEVDGFKLDMQFVLGMLEDDANAALVETMVDLGNRLDIPVVAEGIENEEQLERLRAIDCPIGQGFHLSRPMDFETMLEQFEPDDEPS